MTDKVQSQGTTATTSKAEVNKQSNHYRQYEIVELVGEGTFGKVFKIRNRIDGRIYALKNVLQDPKYKNREVTIVTKVDHPNIVHLYDFFFTKQPKGEYLNLIMNNMPTTLFALIRENRKSKKRFSENHIKAYTFQLFKALSYMEDIQLAHRDLKPLNILVDSATHELQICDFGSAKFISPNQSNVSYMCSRFYRPPELLFGVTDYQVEIDTWSAGCILAEFLTNDPLFTGESTVDQVIEIMKILGCPPQEYFKQCREDFKNLKLPTIQGMEWKKVLRKYHPSPLFVELLSETLTYDRKNRIKPCEALLHPYFNDIGTEQFREFVSGIPHFFDFSLNQMVRYPEVKQSLILKYGEIERVIPQATSDDQQTNAKQNSSSSC